MKPLMLLATAALSLAVVQVHADDKATVDFVGDYVIVAAESDGQKEPDAAVVGAEVHFTEDRILIEDRDHKSTSYIARYAVDRNKNPWVITMTSLLLPTRGDTASGLVEKQGDQVRLIYAQPGGAAPTEFKTKSNQRLLVLKAAAR